MIDFRGLSIDTAATGYTLEATGVGLSAATTNFINVMPASAARLAVTTEPPGAVAVDSPFGLTVAAEDIYGNVDTSFSGSVTVGLANNPVDGVLSVTTPGTATVSAVQGVASFVDLMINAPGTDYTLEATSSGLSTITTGALDVTNTATQLVVTSPPPASVVAGASFGFTVTVEDDNGDVVPSFNGLVNIPLGSNSGGGDVGGILTVAAVNGVAAFTGLSLDKEGVQTLEVTSNGLPSTTTGVVTVAPGPLGQLVVTIPPPLSTNAGEPFELGIAAEDSYGNVETSFYGNITVALSANTSVALDGTTTVSASQGVANFTGLVLDTAGTYAVKAESGGLTVTTSTFSVTAAAAARLFVTTQPPGTDTAGNAFGLTASFTDPYGNLATTFNGSVTVMLANNPGVGVLSGTIAVGASQGVAAFSGLVLDTVAAGYTLTVQSGTADSGLTATTEPINITPGPAAQLAIITQPPAPLTAGTPFGLTVAVEDAFGNLATASTNSVTVALATAPTGSVLIGNLDTVYASQGVAEFNGLALNTAGTGYSIHVTARGLTPATTNSFSVTSAQAARLTVDTQPPIAAAIGTGFGLTVSAEDASGNLATSFDGNVTVAIASGPGGASLAGTLTVTAVNGVATFTGLSVDEPGGYTFNISSGLLISARTAALNVTPAATQLVVTTQPPASVVIGGGFGLTVSAEDASGNLATSFNGDVTITLGNNIGGGTLGGVLNVSAVNGVATFTGLSLDETGEYKFLFTSGVLTSVPSATLRVTPGPVANLAIFGEPDVVTAGSPFQVTVDVNNSQYITETNFTGTVALTLFGYPSGENLGVIATLGGAMRNGQLTFFGLSLHVPGVYSIRATSSGFAAATTPTITVVNPPAAQLGVAGQPPASIAANQAFGLVIEAVDASGNLVPSFNGSVTVALVRKPGVGRLNGALTVTAINGVATFTGLTLTKAAKGDTLRVTASGLSSTTTIAFNVSAPRRLPVKSHPLPIEKPKVTPDDPRPLPRRSIFFPKRVGFDTLAAPSTRRLRG